MSELTATIADLSRRLDKLEATLMVLHRKLGTPSSTPHPQESPSVEWRCSRCAKAILGMVFTELQRVQIKDKNVNVGVTRGDVEAVCPKCGHLNVMRDE